MISVQKQLKAVVGAMLLLSSFAGVQSAFAVGTPASTPVNNRATVSYSVGGAAQTPIESSPTGNSTPGVGVGTNTTFVVDNRIDLTVTEVSGNATIVTPGQANAVLRYNVENTGNATEGFRLTAANLVGGTLFGQVDNTDFAPLNVFDDSNANGVYDLGVDTAANINTLAADANVDVFVVVNVPLGATNNQFANVRLTAQAAVAGTNGGTLETETAGGDTAGVDIVFGDAGRNATEAADDQYAVQSAALSITKTSTVVSDPFNLTVNPKAIPGAVVEYAVTIANTGLAPAGGVSVSDTLVGTLTFESGQYPGATDVEIQVGAGAPTYCIADAADGNGDGCSLAGATVTVNPTVPISVAPGQSAVVRFRVSIN